MERCSRLVGCGRKFEAYLTKTIKKICNGQPIDRKLWEARTRVYMLLVEAGTEPARARRILNLYFYKPSERS